MVESLVAITILLIAVIGPLSLLATALRDSIYLKNEITANYLAQEGLEVVIYFNDKGEELSDGEYCVDGRKELFDDAFYSSAPSGECKISLHSDGYGRYLEGDNPIFERKVSILEVSNESVEDYGAKELEVASVVSWRNRGFLSKREISYKTYVINF